MNFGLSPKEVGNLTYREFNTMMEIHNSKRKIEYETQRNVIFNAIVNTKRKRNSRVIPLFSEHEEKSPLEIMKERSELFGKRPLA